MGVQVVTPSWTPDDPFSATRGRLLVEAYPGVLRLRQLAGLQVPLPQCVTGISTTQEADAYPGVLRVRQLAGLQEPPSHPSAAQEYAGL